MTSDPRKRPFKTSHAFIIGINEYQHFKHLRTAVNDARQLATLLERKHDFKVHPPLLNPTYSQIKQLKNIIFQKVEEFDSVFLYYAGHGTLDDTPDIPHGYLVPKDGSPKGDNLISMQKVHKIIQDLPCKHFLMILDCCFSGTFKWAGRYRDLSFSLPRLVFVL